MHVDDADGSAAGDTVGRGGAARDLDSATLAPGTWQMRPAFYTRRPIQLAIGVADGRRGRWRTPSLTETLGSSSSPGEAWPQLAEAGVSIGGERATATITVRGPVVNEDTWRGRGRGRSDSTRFTAW